MDILANVRFALLPLAALPAALSYRAYMKRIETEYRFLKRQMRIFGSS